MNAQALNIRNAVPEDIPDLLRIEHQSFCDAQWDAEALLAYNCSVAQVGSGIAGFLVWRQIASPSPEFPEQREILNLAVDPAWRRRGVARALLEKELNTSAVYYLEVRESNLAAQFLYRSCGFQEVGRRPDYYHHPTEPAIVMKHE